MHAKEWVDSLNRTGVDMDSVWAILRSFCERKDPEGLTDYFDSALACCEPSFYQNVRMDDTLPFQEELTSMLQVALEKTNVDSTIKAIHCEYYFDGAPNTGCTADLYLCHEFELGSESWLCAWEPRKDEIEGPSVYPYLKYARFTTEDAWDSVRAFIGRFYGLAQLLAAYIRAVQSVKGIRVPCTFGEHDSAFFTIQPNV